MVDSILFLNNTAIACGVYQIGLRTAQVLKESTKFNFIYEELSSETELRTLVTKYNPKLLFFNYQQEVMPWLTKGILNGFRYLLPTCYLHAYLGENPGTDLFNYYVYTDTGAKEDYRGSKHVYVAGRLLEEYKGGYPKNKLPTFGSSGFARSLKRFDYLVERVNNEYDNAVIRLHIPYGHYVDNTEAGNVIRDCRNKVTKPGIDLQIDTTFTEGNKEVLEFLAGNDLNIYPYANDRLGCGTCSSLDLALSVKRPIAVSDTTWFRHVRNATPSILLENNSLDTLIKNGTTPLEPFYAKWTRENYIKRFEDTFEAILLDPVPFSPSYSNSSEKRTLPLPYNSMPASMLDKYV